MCLPYCDILSIISTDRGVVETTRDTMANVFGTITPAVGEKLFSVELRRSNRSPIRGDQEDDENNQHNFNMYILMVGFLHLQGVRK